MSNSGTVDVQFSRSYSCDGPNGTKDKRPLFLAADGVHGVVNIDYSAITSPSMGNYIIKLCLYGAVNVQIPRECIPSKEKGPGLSKIRKEILNLVHVLPVNLLPNTPQSVSRATVKFDLVLPKSILYHPDNGDLCNSAVAALSRRNDHLPSSLSATTVLPSPALASCPPNFGARIDINVSYTLQAHIIRDDKIIGSISKDIRIFDNGDPQPPICTADYPSEYLCQQKTALRKHVFTKVGGLFVTLTEPKPFVFCAEKALASTNLPITFDLDLPHTVLPNDPNFEIEAAVTWQIRNSTFATLEPMTSVPTVKEWVRCQQFRAPAMALVTTLGPKRKLKLNLWSWERKQPEKTGYGPNDKSWTKSDELALSIPQSALPVPTFFTPFVSRRYSILFHVRVSGVIGSADLRMEVPVQIVYQAGRVAMDRESEIVNHRPCGEDDDQQQLFASDADGELPTYVR